MRIQSTFLAAAGLLAAAMIVPVQAHAVSSPGTALDSQPAQLVEKAHAKRTCWWRKGKRHCRYVSHRHRWGNGYGYRPGFNLYIGPPRHGVHRGDRHHRKHR